MKIEEVDGEELVKTFAEEMEEMLGRKMKSVKVIITHSAFNGNQFDITLFKSKIVADLLTALVCVIFPTWETMWAECMINLLYFITEVSRGSRGC